MQTQQRIKTFAALSLMAVSACAVDMVVENPYVDLFVPSFQNTLGDWSKREQGQPEPHIKVNVWDTISTELKELMAEVQSLTTTVDDQGGLLKNTQESFGLLMADLDSLKMTDTANRINIATQNALDARQD